MNLTRRVLSAAESAAATNEPRPHQHLQLLQKGAQAGNFFTQIIHQQLNPQSTSLPALLTNSLVAFQSQLDNEAEDAAGLASSHRSQHQSLAADQRQNQRFLIQNTHQDSQHQLVKRAEQYFTTTDSLLAIASSSSSSSPATDNLHQPIMQSAATATTLVTTAAPDDDWWSEYWSRQPFPSGYTQSSITLLACLITTIIFLIVVGNLLVCIAIFTEKSLRPTQNWFIASLAVSDMLLGLVVMPFSLARELMGFWIFGTLWCDIHEAVDVLLTTASINTLCLISLDRYWSITQAVSYLKKRTPRRGAFMIVIVWILSAAVSLPPLFGWKKPAAPVAPANASAPAWPAEGGPQDRYQRHAARLLERRELATPLGRQPDPGEASAGPNASYLAGRQQPAAAPQPALATEYPTCQLSDDLGYVLYSAVGSFFIPCGVMVFTYIKIFLAARSRARRAINKQSRGNAATKQRLAARRNLDPSHSQVEPSTALHSSSLTAASPLVVGAGPAQAHSQPDSQPPEFVMKGKLVIVERRKSQAAAGEPAEFSAPGLRSKSAASERIEEEPALPGDEGAKVSQVDQLDSCTLTTSGAKQASPSALHSAASNDSSMITVMNAAMGELPVTMFNFQRPEPQVLERGDRKAAALLKAISEADRQLLSELEGAEAADEQVPDIVVDRRGTGSAAPEPPQEATNETCFMTIEEDSDMFDAQTGRTIMMIASTARQAAGSLPKSQVMTMRPLDGQVDGTCQHRQQPRSASSYCGSSLTIDEEDLDECPGDDEELTDDCNRYSASCTLDQCCQGASTCAHCRECELAASGCTCHLASNGGDSPLKHQQCPSELEAQSILGDDNASHMTEYRSNDDLSSSIAGHDVLDATESFHRKHSVDKSATNGGRKRSIIGFRLTRLGSTGPLSSQSGGLLALVSNQQQQTGAGAGKNLKALRQNFFFKLNQLTAKSAAKAESKSHKSNPSSAQSSGTEHEPSVDCPTTSAVQSNEYPQETTIADDYEQQTSNESHHSMTANKYSTQDKDSPLEKRVGSSGDKQTTSQLALLARGAAAQANLKAARNQPFQSDDRALLLHGPPQDRRLVGVNSVVVTSSKGARGEPPRPKSRAGGGLGNHSSSVQGPKTSAGPVSRAYLASDNERHKRKLAKARERRATLILGLIMTTFICSWMPFFTFYVLRAICEDCRKAVSPRIEAFIFWMGYCNSAINPIIYTIFNRDFRKAFRKILFKCL